MQEYRKTMPPEDDRRYHHVVLGPLNALNPATRCAFPTWDAAVLFADNHRGDRTAVVVTPDGRCWDGEGWVDVELEPMI